MSLISLDTFTDMMVTPGLTLIRLGALNGFISVDADQPAHCAHPLVPLLKRRPSRMLQGDGKMRAILCLFVVGTLKLFNS